MIYLVDGTLQYINVPINKSKVKNIICRKTKMRTARTYHDQEDKFRQTQILEHEMKNS